MTYTVSWGLILYLLDESFSNLDSFHISILPKALAHPLVSYYFCIDFLAFDLDLFPIFPLYLTLLLDPLLIFSISGR